MLSMALDELPLLVNGRKLEEMIKRQKLDEYSRLRPVNQKYFSLSGVGGNPPMDKTDYRQADKLFRKQYAAEQKWELYEREVSLPPKIQADFNRLLKIGLPLKRIICISWAIIWPMRNSLCSIRKKFPTRKI